MKKISNEKTSPKKSWASKATYIEITTVYMYKHKGRYTLGDKLQQQVAATDYSVCTGRPLPVYLTMNK